MTEPTYGYASRLQANSAEAAGLKAPFTLLAAPARADDVRYWFDQEAREWRKCEDGVPMSSYFRAQGEQE